MADLTAVREHMEVVGSDGRHVGVVDHVLDNGEIQLTRRDSEAEAEPGPAHHHFIPITWVAQVDANAERIVLSLSKDDAEARWRHGAPPAEG